MKAISLDYVKNIDSKHAKAHIRYTYHELTHEMETIVVIEHIIFDIAIHGTYYEITAMEKGQRTDKDQLLIISRAQRLMDDYVP